VITLSIDGTKIQAPPGRTLLELAREHAIWIPTLCYHEALKPYGGCRLCVVELVTPRGLRLVAACTYPCELLLARAGHVPFIQELAASLGVHNTPYTLPSDDCILCARCVRACREIVGVGAISMAERGPGKEVVTPFRISSADCIECTTCMLVCPTGAITLQDIIDRDRTLHTWPSKYARRACRLCDYHTDGLLQNEG
jgi:bidirectional [NiFe] hydrogenase diaphorase subunit